MRYADLKKSFDAARREQLAADKELNRLDKELSALVSEYNKVDSSFAESEERYRQEALSKYRKKCTDPYDSKLRATEEKLSKVSKEYETKYAEITFDNLMQNCSSKQDILADVRKCSDALEERLQKLVGKRFYTIILNRLDAQELDFNANNLDKLIQYYNRSERMLKGYEGVSEDVSTVMETFENAVLEESDGGRVTTVLAIVVLVLGLFFRRVVLTGVCLCLAITSVYNIFRNYKVYHILIVQKAVKDNIEGIDRHLKEQVEQEVEERHRELDSVYKPTIADLEEKVQALQTKLQEASANADASFSFDRSEFELRKSAEIEKVDKRKSSLLIQQRTQKELLEQKTKVVEDLGKQLHALLNTLKDEYLSGVGTDVIFKPDFLFDIDVAKGKPIFFKHPQESCLFLYTSIDDVYDFVRLLSAELRAKLNPYNLNIVTVDQRDMGQDLIYFTTADDGNAEEMASVYSIVTDDAGVKKMIDDTAADLLRRQENIRREFSDIETYNNEMVKLRSLTETYEFQFIIDPPSSYVQSQNSERCWRVGGSLGIFTHLFISKDKFATMRETTNSILDAIGKVYYLENGNYFERAKDFVVDDLLTQAE